MLGTVVVGYDGSDSAHDAVALGEVLTEPVRTDLIVAHVFPWEPGRAPADRSIAELERTAALVGGHAQAVVSDMPANGLQDLATEVAATLLIVGSSGGDSHETVAGPVGMRLLHGAPCPVAIAPRGFARRYAPDIRTIALGYDGSDQAAVVLRDAANLTLALRARLRVIAAASGKNGFSRDLDDALADALASLPEATHPSAVLRSGQPAGVLLEEAEADADLLVVGSRRDGPPNRAMLGSVSTELVHKAPCPVLVVPHRVRAAEIAAARSSLAA